MTTQLNEIGPETADIICRLIDYRYGEVGYPPEPIIEEEVAAETKPDSPKKKEKVSLPPKKVLKPAYTRPYPKFE